MYLLFDTLKTAQLAEVEINKNKKYPIIGRNAKTGKLEPDKQQTVRWAESHQDKKGKWFIPKPGNEYMTSVKNFTKVTEIEVKADVNTR
ncbi:MAG: hypothetical protein U9P90_02250 [Patescibacteria group bacterium]|nr:hypothetical protein [Patescibacteria group bacterium]